MSHKHHNHQCIILSLVLSVIFCAVHVNAQDGSPKIPLDNRDAFSRMLVWDDGLCEMSYFDATDSIYGETRRYTRVHLLNRQWMDASRGVKTEPTAGNAVAVFKLNITEEIATENYNYRYLNTVFLKRPSLAPFKMVVSSQEWCGASYKHLRWTDGSLSVRSFGYFPGEGESEWTIGAEAMPFESLVVLSRAVVAAGKGVDLALLSSMRSTRTVEPQTRQVRMDLDSKPRRPRVPAGSFETHRVSLSSESGLSAVFDVEAAPPYRLIAFKMGNVEAKLRGVERRAYWDRASGSNFHKRGEAP